MRGQQDSGSPERGHKTISIFTLPLEGANYLQTSLKAKTEHLGEELSFDRQSPHVEA